MIINYKNRLNIPSFDSYFIGSMDSQQIIFIANPNGIGVTQKDKFGKFNTLTLSPDEALKILQPYLRKIKLQKIKNYEILRSNNR